MSDAATAPWLQLTLEAIDHSPEQLEDALLLSGALAVTLEDAGDQPVLEPAPGETPLWTHTRVTGLFDAQTDIEVVKKQLRRFLHTSDLPECRLTALEERDWVRALGLEHEIGSLEPGKKADLITMDLDEIGWSPRGGQDIYTALVYSVGGYHVRDVMVDGRWLMRDAKLTTLDYPLMSEGLDLAQAELQRRVKAAG